MNALLTVCLLALGKMPSQDWRGTPMNDFEHMSQISRVIKAGHYEMQKSHVDVSYYESHPGSIHMNITYNGQRYTFYCGDKNDLTVEWLIDGVVIMAPRMYVRFFFKIGTSQIINVMALQ